MQRLRSGFALLAIGATVDCFDTLAQQLIVQTRDAGVSPEGGSKNSQYSAITLLAWSLGELAAVRAGHVSGQDYRNSLSNATQDPVLRTALVDAFTLSQSYFEYLLNGAGPNLDTLATVYARLERLPGDIREPMMLGGAHHGTVAAREWADVETYVSTLKKFTDEPAVLSRQVYRLRSPLQFGSDRTILRRLLQDWDVLPPTDDTLARSTDSASPSPSVRLIADLTAGSSGTRHIDEVLGPVFANYEKTQGWQDNTYGEVRSQSDVVASATTLTDGLVSGTSWQVLLMSRVIGGYDPPWPGRAFPTRPAHNHKSSAHVSLNWTLVLPRCDSGPTCQAVTKVIVATTEDVPSRGATSSVTVSQLVSAKQVPLVPATNRGRLEYTIDRSIGDTHVDVTMRRSDEHSGASDWFTEEQWASIWTDALGARRGTPEWLLDTAARDWFDQFEPGADPNRVPSGAILAEALGRRASAASDAYLELYPKALLLYLALHAPSGRLTSADKNALEGMQRYIATVLRSTHRKVVERHIEDLVSVAAALDAPVLDFDIAALMLKSTDSAQFIENLIYVMDRHGGTLAAAEHENLRNALLGLERSANRENIELAVDLVSLKAQLNQWRRRLRDDISGYIIELARLEVDCSAVRARFATWLDSQIDSSGALKCGSGR
jgi:hypothetical protein